MKKLRHLVSILLLMVCVSLHSQTALLYDGLYKSTKTPLAMKVRFGDSELTGLAGIEFQASRFAVSAGWKPFSLYTSNCKVEQFNSYGISSTFYTRPWYESCPYVTAGWTSNGYSYETFNNYQESIPAVMVMAGWKFVLSDLHPNATLQRTSWNTGIGMKTSEEGTMLIFEFVINFALLKR